MTGVGAGALTKRRQNTYVKNDGSQMRRASRPDARPGLAVYLAGTDEHLPFRQALNFRVLAELLRARGRAVWRRCERNGEGEAGASS